MEEGRRQLKAIVSYDGSAYVGWETQKNGLAVQQVLEEALFRITRETIEVDASGRTDAGVHALGQVVSFSTAFRHPLAKLRLGLNAVLPLDIAVLDISEVEEGFHARLSARSKLYRYRVLNHPARWPLLSSQTYHVPTPLDVEAMRRAGAALVGTHDFTAFAREAWRKKSCVRTMLKVRIEERSPEIHFEFEATGFLYNMIRILVGTLLEVGAGKREEGSIAALLAEAAPRKHAGYTVPPQGLALVEVFYGSADHSPLT